MAASMGYDDDPLRRDPRSHGLWARTAPSAPATASLSGEISADVVVIGGGYTGLSTALHLAERRRRRGCAGGGPDRLRRLRPERGPGQCRHVGHARRPAGRARPGPRRATARAFGRRPQARVRPDRPAQNRLRARACGHAALCRRASRPAGAGTPGSPMGRPWRGGAPAGRGRDRRQGRQRRLCRRPPRSARRHDPAAGLRPWPRPGRHRRRCPRHDRQPGRRRRGCRYALDRAHPDRCRDRGLGRRRDQRLYPCALAGDPRRARAPALLQSRHRARWPRSCGGRSCPSARGHGTRGR